MSINTIGMRFTIIDVECNCDRESDYETAIEMSHWSMSETQMTIETAYGLRILLTEREESTSYSYLEPDFDEFEESGEVHYLTHQDESKGKHRAEYSARVALPAEKSRLSKVFFAALERSDNDQEAMESALHFVHDEDFDEAVVPLKLSKEWFQKFFTEFGNLSSGSIIVQLPPAVENEVRSLEKRLEKIRAANRNVEIDNSVTVGIYEILGMPRTLDHLLAM